MSAGPLAGTTVLELGGIGPAPFGGMILAGLGATVIRVVRDQQWASQPVLDRDRLAVRADLKNLEQAAAVRDLALRVDAVLEGFRPGVAERLGLGPAELRSERPDLVYGRMTGWGQDGPWAQVPGHDINYLALTGGLHAIGPRGEDPVPPLNLVADFGGGGMFLALGVVAALARVRVSGEGDVVDAAMVDGTSNLLAMAHGHRALGKFRLERGTNPLDGAAPFYRTYRCADGEHMAVGCVEPQFFATLLRILDLAGEDGFEQQMNQAAWPEQAAVLEKVFLQRTRSEWSEIFEGTDACVTPVLTLAEAAEHPHNLARGTVPVVGGVVQPRPAPRFASTPHPAAREGAEALLDRLGLAGHPVAELML